MFLLPLALLLEALLWHSSCTLNGKNSHFLLLLLAILYLQLTDKKKNHKAF